MRGRRPLTLRRAFSEPLLLLAAFSSILLATTTLVALTMYASSIAKVGVRRAMETAPAETTATTVSAPVQQDTFAGAEKAVLTRLGALGRDGGHLAVPHEIALSARSDSYALPGQERREHPELTRFGTYDGLDRQARLLVGTWPRPVTDGTIEVALSRSAAQAMDLAAGDEFSVVGRLDHKPVRARLTGVFQLKDPYAGRWKGEELLLRGVEHGGYTTYGPLMVPRDTFVGRFTGTSVAVTWIAVPDLRNLTQDRLRPFAASVARLGEDLKRDCPFLALLVVAALAIWQLQHYGAPVTATTGGELGIDPLIVTGPALALLCGGMLGLRLVPRASRLVARFAAKRPGLAPALGSWQVSRRPMRYSGPALLLTMAVAIGVVSMATSATWRTSQLDQARHQAGADLRVSGPVDSAELGALGRGSRYATLPGIIAISPVYRGTIAVSGGSGTLIAADATKLGGMLLLRPDLTGRPISTLAARLAARRPDAPTVPLPGTPKKLTFDLRLRLSMPAASPGYADLGLRVVLADALGVQREVRLGPLVPDGKPHQVSVNLSALAGRSGALSHPLGIRGFALRVPIPDQGTGFELGVEAVRTDTGAPVTMPPSMQWGHTVQGEGHLSGERVTAGPALVGLTVPAPKDHVLGDPVDPEQISLILAPTGVANADLFRPVDGDPDPAAGGGTLPGGNTAIFGPLPVVITSDIAAKEQLVEGRTGTLTMDGRPIKATVAGIVDAMPGAPPGLPAIFADLPTLLARDVATAHEPRPAGEWWMSTRNGDTTAAAAELARHPEWDQTVVDLGSLTRNLRDDPLASGLQGALVLGFAAALVFAVLGFLVNAAVAARERVSEFAILRALGVSFRQIFGLLAVEQAFLIGLSLVGGTLLTAGIATLVVPHIVLTGQAASVTPVVLLDIPWPATLAMPAGIAVLLFSIVAGLARSLRRQGLGRALRIGEDR